MNDEKKLSERVFSGEFNQFRSVHPDPESVLGSQVAALEAQRSVAVDFLKLLDQRGGLGLDVHAALKEVLTLAGEK